MPKINNQVINKVEAVIEAEDTWSDPLHLVAGYFSFALWGDFDAEVVLQFSHDGGNTWVPADYRYDAGRWEGREPEGGLARFGVPAGKFVSGPVNGRLAQL
ncbi:MAG: hypothetical protein KQH53_08295 [Desulfarculaceae bacterium]|nr:hypothetical protein [Desulfarculaceae bacterium]